NYPPALPLRPLRHAPSGTISVAGSKSITNRALVLAALASRKCELWHPLQSEDTEIMVEGLRQLGFKVNILPYVWIVSRPPASPLIPRATADLCLGNSGTSM